MRQEVQVEQGRQALVQVQAQALAAEQVEPLQVLALVLVRESEVVAQGRELRRAHLRLVAPLQEQEVLLPPQVALQQALEAPQQVLEALLQELEVQVQAQVQELALAQAEAMVLERAVEQVLERAVEQVLERAVVQVELQELVQEEE